MLQTLFNGKHLQVTFDRQGTDVAVVTFSDHFQPEGSFRAGFGQEALEQAGVTAIHVKSSFNHWWQTPEIFHAMDIVRAVLAGYGGGRVVTYGASMGGYAAIHFASSLNAVRAIAYSPQSNLWDDRETRWRREATDWPRLLPPIESVLSGSIEYLIVADPRERLDMMQASGVPGAKLLLLENCGHRSVPLLVEAGHLKKMMLDVIGGAEYEAVFLEMRSVVRENKRKSSTYLAHLLARAMRNRKHRGIRRILARMRSGEYLSTAKVHRRDYIAVVRAAAEAQDEWTVGELFRLAGGADMGQPFRAAFFQTLKRNGFDEFVRVLDLEKQTVK
ncbi:alpha/beta fold hydrolase [Rhizobium arsenicireducens]